MAPLLEVGRPGMLDGSADPPSPLREEHRRQVPLARVRQHGDDRLAGERVVACEPERHRRRGATRDAGKDALLLGESPRHLDGLLVRHGLDATDHGEVEVLRGEAGADPLDLVRRGCERCAREGLGDATSQMASRLGRLPPSRCGELSLPGITREDRANAVLELAFVGLQRGLSSTTGMSRLVPAWYLSYSGHSAVMVGQTRFLSSAVPVRALTGRTLSRTWIFTSGCATRFRYHPGCSGAPPFDATMT